MTLKYIWFSFDGRINRQIYWIQGFLALIAAEIVIFALAGALAMVSEVLALVPLILFIGVIWASIALGVKRCHDRDKSGWFLLIALIPIIGPIWMLVELGFLAGTQGENRFGPDPLGGTAPAAAEASDA